MISRPTIYNLKPLHILALGLGVVAFNRNVLLYNSAFDIGSEFADHRVISGRCFRWRPQR